jgi:hypothetical protein
VLPVLVLAAAMQDDEVSDLRVSVESHLSPFKSSAGTMAVSAGVIEILLN